MAEDVAAAEVVAEESLPDFIPEKFRADSLEASAEKMSRSYSELERKLGQTTQLLKDQQEQFDELAGSLAELEATGGLAAEEFVGAEPTDGPLSLSVAQLSALAQRAAFAGAQSVTKALTTGKVQAPESVEQLTAILPGLMSQQDPRWAETDPQILAQVIASQPQLLPEDMADMTQITNGLATAAQIARGYQAELTLNSYRQAAATQTMKMNAQTISGAGNKPDPLDADEEFYARLKSAARNNWSSRRR